MFTSYGQLVMNAIQQRHAQMFTTLSQLQLLFSNPQSTDVSFSASKLSMHKCLSPSECCLPPSARMLFSILLSHRCVHLPGQYSKLLRQNVQCLRQLKMHATVSSYIVSLCVAFTCATEIENPLCLYCAGECKISKLNV